MRKSNSMKRNTRQKQKFWQRLWTKRHMEIQGGLFLAAGLVCALSLVSYSPADASLNTASSEVPHNLLGAFGSYAADFLMQSFGPPIWLAVIVMLSWGWRLLAKLESISIWLRVLLLPAGLFLVSAAAESLPVPNSWPLASGFGGWVGHLVLKNLTMLNPIDGTFGVVTTAILSAAAGLALIGWSSGLSREEWAYYGNVAWAVTHYAALKSWRFLCWAFASAVSGIKSLFASTPELEIEVEEEEEEEAEERLELPKPPERKKKEILVEKTAEPKKQAVKQRELDLSADDFQLPSLELLKAQPVRVVANQSEESLSQNAKLLESVLNNYGVEGEVVKVRPGPVVTLYELEPSPGTRAARVIGLADDIARNMSTLSVRVASVPGRSVLGIELPNQRRETVFMRELLEVTEADAQKSALPLILGKDIGGSPIVADLARMPHLLIAGTTGSGKSVAINTMILSLLYRLSPEKCKLILIDPKMLELSVYQDIPHLLTPVVTDPKKAIVALKWAVKEMNNRYQAMSKLGVRNIEGYNQRLAEARKKGEVLVRSVQTGFDPETGKPVYEDQPLDLNPLPYIVVVVDEMADLMMVAGKEIEGAIQRLAQMARAAGLHLIMATQRPSVDVITGTIKANFPVRISFQVTSKIDSRTILGETGAEQLLGQGDMLYMAGGGRITRVHGPYVSDAEVEGIAKFLRDQAQPSYLEDVTKDEEEGDPFAAIGGGEDGGDGLYQRALELVLRERKASTSFIQRHLQIGYNRAARIMDEMESRGVVSPANHVGKREVLIETMDQKYG